MKTVMVLMKYFATSFLALVRCQDIFKPYYQIISNDILYFSYLLTSSTIENNAVPDFVTLKRHGINDPVEYLESSEIQQGLMNEFVAEAYSPKGKRGACI